MHWLKWLSIILLGMAGAVGLALSLCGGVFLLTSLGGGASSMQGIAGIAAVALAVGLVVLVISLRQLRAVWRERHTGVDSDYPREVKRLVILAGIDFVVSGLWFFLPLIVSVLRRRTWARTGVLIALGIKWLSGYGLWHMPRGALGYLFGFGIVTLALDIAVVVTLFSRPVTEWLQGRNADGGQNAG